mgnify:FL=1
MNLKQSNKPHLFLTLCLALFYVLNSANIPVYIDDPIYDFLQRMENRGIISGYSGLELPLNRDKIASFIRDIRPNIENLNSIEKNLYIKFRSQYYLELFSQKEAQLPQTRIKFINTGSLPKTLSKVFSRNTALREQHLIKYETPHEFLWADVDMAAQNQSKKYLNRQILSNQILLRGGFRENLSGFLQFDQYLKLNADQYDAPLQEEKGRFINEDVYFSNSYAGLGYAGQYFEAGIYQQPFLWGASRENNLTFSNNGPPFPYFRLSAHIGWLKYTLLHGGLVNDSTGHKFKNVSPDVRDMPKNVAAQRFEVSLFDGHTYLSFNQMVIYSNRTLEWAYLVPFNFYFAAEHYLEDRDNTLMSFDIKSKIFKNTEAYGTIFIDELKWSELGNQWWGNKHAFQIGLRNHSYLLQYPTNLQIEYTVIRPWTYTHKVFNNNYTNENYGMGFPYGPNSQLLFFDIDTYFTYRLKAFLKYKYLRHGHDTKQTIYGGNATSNYTDRNPKFDYSTEWLMGDIQTTEEFVMGIKYEYCNDCYLFGSLRYMLENDGSEKDYLFTNIGLSINL